MLYLHVSLPRLALKLFRGEPAISGFDWNFSLSTPHPHPFQRMWVRSSIAFYGSFNLDMDRSPGFGSAHTDSGPIKTWFPYGSAPLVLNLAACATRRTVLQKVRGSPYRGVPQLVNTGFQVLFHSPPGVLFTFPSQYYALSVTKEYLALRGGPRSFSQGSTCLDLLWIPLCPLRFHVRGFHPLRLAFPKTIPLPLQNHVRGPNPSMHAHWFGLFPFRNRYTYRSSFLSPPPAT